MVDLASASRSSCGQRRGSRGKHRIDVVPQVGAEPFFQCVACAMHTYGRGVHADHKLDDNVSERSSVNDNSCEDLAWSGLRCCRLSATQWQPKSAVLSTRHRR